MNMRNIVLAVLLGLVLMVSACQTPTTGDNTTNVTASGENVTAPTNEETQGTSTSGEVDASKASFKVSGIEGDLIKIPVNAVDLDGDSLKYTFEKPFNDKGLWLTEVGDEGEYLIKVTVTDGLVSTSEFVLVNVGRANRAPTIECPEKITLQETETITIDCNIFDEEGDPVVVGYDGFMRTSSYKTTYGDAGEYSVIVRARDKDHETTEKVEIVIQKKNRLPVIEELGSIDVMETTSITVKPVVFDPDGDKITLYFSEPLDETGSWSPEYGDRGEYEVTVVASDGQANVTQEFTLVALKKNREPVIKQIAQIEVFEGEKVTIPVQAYDPDGDDITVTYSNWKDVGEFTTTYDDAFPGGCNTKGCTATYYVDVTISDGTLETMQSVAIKVTDRNRPPELLWN